MEKNSKPKIGLIGPVSPFRGGIAHYTEQLRNSLDKHSTLTTVSFYKLYPKFLYPGKSDVDLDAPTHEGKDVLYILNPLNPISWLNAVKIIKNNQCEMVLVNWWTLFLAPSLAFISWRLRKEKIKVIFLCHNIRDHDSSYLQGKISELLFSLADKYVVHTHAYENELISQGKGSKTILTPHPVHENYPLPSGKLKKRGKLELLFFGFIRPYKGLDILLDAMEILDTSDIYLTIVGEVWGDAENLKRKIEAINAIGKNRIEFNFEYTSNKDAAEYFQRADIVVLPYVTATGSAVSNLAYFYGKPIICSRLEGLMDSCIEGVTGWMVEPSSPKALSSILANLKRSDAEGLREGIENFCQNNSWNNLALICVKSFSRKSKF